VLILAGDHIYLMDYQPMLRAHIQSAADLTVAVRRVNPHETHRYGIVTPGADDRIIEFREKPRRSRETLAVDGHLHLPQRVARPRRCRRHDYLDFGKHVSRR
jgi:glucose-1-phosphate adenylyltransferase